MMELLNHEIRTLVKKEKEMDYLHNIVISIRIWRLFKILQSHCGVFFSLLLLCYCADLFNCPRFRSYGLSSSIHALVLNMFKKQLICIFIFMHTHVYIYIFIYIYSNPPLIRGGSRDLRKYAESANTENSPVPVSPTPVAKECPLLVHTH